MCIRNSCAGGGGNSGSARARAGQSGDRGADDPIRGGAAARRGQSGVQVVPEYEEEVFFVDGWYWYRSGPYWYRTRDHRGGWVVVERRYVPATLVKIPPGHYKHYKAKGLPPGQAKKLERERERGRESVVATPNGPVVVHEREKGDGNEGKGHGHGKWKD